MGATVRGAAMDPSERLTAMIGGAESEIHLTEAALLVASHRYPDLDVQHYLDVIGAYVDDVSNRLPSGCGAAEKVTTLNHYLFDELGFAPNDQDYYDPRNSLLNDVLERRTGIPITLSLLYMAVGKQLGLALNGVCYPGHFLVKCVLPEGMIVLDPFSRGQSLGIADLQNMLREAQGGEVSRAIVAGLLVRASKREILIRMLRNLKAIYLNSRDFDDALTIMNWIVTADPECGTEFRDRGVIYEQMDCFRAAAADFERYLELEPGCSDSEAIRHRLVQLQRSVSRLN